VVNCLQRKSAVIIQRSLREGFGLTVSEALYKGTPVVASNVGGIPLQIIHGENGFLHKPNDIDGFAKSIVKLLKNDKLRKKMGKNGKEYVKKHFLITRLILDWLNLFEKYLH
jgi:trehalose synthase